MSALEPILTRSLKAARRQANVRTEEGELVFSEPRYRFLQARTLDYTGSLAALPNVARNPRSMEDALQRHLSTYSTRVTVMAHVATHRFNRSLSPKRLDELANMIEFTSVARPIRVIPVPRPGKSPRRVTSWSDIDYARQILIADVIYVCDPHAV